MPTTIKELRLERLNVDERLALAEELWESIAVTPEAVPVTNTQQNDLQRRLDAYLDNPKAGSPWAEVKARLQIGN